MARSKARSKARSEAQSKARSEARSEARSKKAADKMPLQQPSPSDEAQPTVQPPASPESQPSSLPNQNQGSTAKSFRPILPKNNGEPVVAPQPSFGRLNKPWHAREACERCRKHKNKCDEDRPTCGRCRRRGNECVYTRVNELPPSMLMALKIFLRKLIVGLDENNPDKLVQYVRQLKQASNPVAMVMEQPDPPEPWQNPSVEAVDSDAPLTSDENDMAPGDDSDQDPDASLASLNPDKITERMSKGVIKYHDIMFGGSSRSLPDKSQTRNAVIGYFTISSPHDGRLYTPSEVVSCFNRVYSTPKPIPSNEDLTDIGCLMAVAARGAQRWPQKFPEGMSNDFFEAAKRALDTLTDMDKPRLIRIHASLAHYQYVEKQGMNITYAHQGLAMCRDLNLQDDRTFEANPELGAATLQLAVAVLTWVMQMAIHRNVPFDTTIK